VTTFYHIIESSWQLDDEKFSFDQVIRFVFAMFRAISCKYRAC